MSNKKMETRVIFFNEAQHRYTDNLNNPYTSVTTLIDKYTEKFKSVEMAKACARKGRGVYAGKSWKQILKMWEKNTKAKCKHGNIEHNFLESTIKNINNFWRLKNKLKESEIYTLDTIIKNKKVGLVDKDVLRETKLKDDRFAIYLFLEQAIEKNYHLYAEVGVYDYNSLIAGLVDCPLINWSTKKFIIVDWKTYSAPLIPYDDEKYKWKSGYFRKDETNQIMIDDFVETNQYMAFPLDHLQQSTYVKAALQLSLYAYLFELKGLTCNGLVLFHITHDTYKLGDIETLNNPDMLGLPKIKNYVMPYLKNEIMELVKHHVGDGTKLRNNIQLELL